MNYDINSRVIIKPIFFSNLQKNGKIVILLKLFSYGIYANPENTNILVIQTGIDK